MESCFRCKPSGSNMVLLIRTFSFFQIQKIFPHSINSRIRFTKLHKTIPHSRKSHFLLKVTSRWNTERQTGQSQSCFYRRQWWKCCPHPCTYKFFWFASAVQKHFLELGSSSLFVFPDPTSSSGLLGHFFSLDDLRTMFHILIPHDIAQDSSGLLHYTDIVALALLILNYFHFSPPNTCVFLYCSLLTINYPKNQIQRLF